MVFLHKVDRGRRQGDSDLSDQKLAVVAGLGWTAVVIAIVGVMMVHFGWHLH